MLLFGVPGKKKHFPLIGGYFLGVPVCFPLFYKKLAPKKVSFLPLGGGGFEGGGPIFLSARTRGSNPQTNPTPKKSGSTKGVPSHEPSDSAVTSWSAIVAKTSFPPTGSLDLAWCSLGGFKFAQAGLHKPPKQGNLNRQSQPEIIKSI